MSQENAEIVRRLQARPEVDIAALLRDEAAWRPFAEAAAPRFDPDFECVAVLPIEGEVLFEGVGINALRAAWLEWMEPWKSYRVEIEDVIDAGDRIVVLTRDYGRRVGAETEVALTGGAVWTVKAGRVTRAAFYPQRRQALEAVGMSE